MPYYKADGELAGFHSAADYWDHKIFTPVISFVVFIALIIGGLTFLGWDLVANIVVTALQITVGLSAAAIVVIVVLAGIRLWRAGNGTVWQKIGFWFIAFIAFLITALAVSTALIRADEYFDVAMVVVTASSLCLFAFLVAGLVVGLFTDLRWVLFLPVIIGIVILFFGALLSGAAEDIGLYVAFAGAVGFASARTCYLWLEDADYW